MIPDATNYFLKDLLPPIPSSLKISRTVCALVWALRFLWVSWHRQSLASFIKIFLIQEEELLQIWGVGDFKYLPILSTSNVSRFFYPKRRGSSQVLQLELCECQLFLVMPISSFFRQLFNTLGLNILRQNTPISIANVIALPLECPISLEIFRRVDKGHGFGYISPRLRSYQSFQSFWGRGDKIVVFVFFLESDLTIRFIISHIPSWGVLGSSGT